MNTQLGDMVCMSLQYSYASIITFEIGVICLKLEKNRCLFNRRKNDSRKKIYYNIDTGKENISPAALHPISRDACTTLAEQPNESILQRNHPNSSLSLLHTYIHNICTYIRTLL